MPFALLVELKPRLVVLPCLISTISGTMSSLVCKDPFPALIEQQVYHKARLKALCLPPKRVSGDTLSLLYRKLAFCFCQWPSPDTRGWFLRKKRQQSFETADF